MLGAAAETNVVDEDVAGFVAIVAVDDVPWPAVSDGPRGRDGDGARGVVGGAGARCWWWAWGGC
jgi:hypothetical protein